MIDFKLVPIPNQSFGARQVDSETVFLSPAGDEIHSLDEIGSFIWHQIDGHQTLADILAAVLAAYEVEEAQARDDLDAFVAVLADRGLVSLRDGV